MKSTSAELALSLTAVVVALRTCTLVLCSGISSGTSGKLFGHEVSGSDNQVGPFHQSSVGTSCEAMHPRDARSAGLSIDETCLQADRGSSV